MSAIPSPDRKVPICRAVHAMLGIWSGQFDGDNSSDSQAIDEAIFGMRGSSADLVFEEFGKRV
jgi:hypothetical protein